MENEESKNNASSGNPEGEKNKGVGGNLEKLSREDLVAKCRNLLALAHKAKAAKDEATAEVKKLKVSMKNVEAVNAEADALREMVTDLTEGKIAHTTKVESLQRQLKVITSEIESLREVENNLLADRNQLITENSQLAEDKQSCLEKLKAVKESSFEKHKLIEKTWETEKLVLQEKVENLEAQNGQVDILKSKCRKLLEEKTSLEDELTKQQKIIAKSIRLEGEVKLMKEEKKADAIILETCRSENKKLQEKLKSAQSLLQQEKEQLKKAESEGSKKEELQKELNEHKSLLSASESKLSKIQELLTNLQQEKELFQKKFEETKESKSAVDGRVKTLKDQLSDSESKLAEIQEQLMNLQQEKEHFQKTFEETKESKSATDDRVKSLEDQLNDSQSKVAEIQEQLTNLQQEKEHIQKTFEETKESKVAVDDRVKSLEDEVRSMADKNQQFVTQISNLSSEKENSTTAMSAEIDTLKAQLEGMTKEKEKLDARKEESSQNENLQLLGRIKELEEDVNTHRNEVNCLQEQLKSRNEEKDALDQKLQQHLDEINELSKKLEKSEGLESELAKRSKAYEQKVKEEQQLRSDLQTVSHEKLEFSKECEGLRANLKMLEEQVETYEKQKQNYEHQLSDCKKEALTKLNEDTKHKEVLENMAAETSDLKALNDELTNKLSLLESNLQENEITLNELRCSGNSIVSLCKKLYPSDEGLLPSSTEKDVHQMMKCVVELLNVINSRWSECRYIDVLSNIIKSLDRFHDICNIKNMPIADVEWTVHAETFGKLIENLVDLSKCMTTVLGSSKTDNTQVADKCHDITTVYEKFCTHVTKEFINLETMKKQLNDVNKEKLAVEENMSGIIKEKDILSQNMTQMQQKITSLGKRCTDLESQLAEGDTEKSEVVKNLQEQLRESCKEKDALGEKCQEIQREKSDVEKSLKNQKEEIENIHCEQNTLLQEKKSTEVEKQQLQIALENLKSQSVTKEKSLLNEKHDLEKKLTLLSEEKINLEKEFASMVSNKASAEENASKEKHTLGEKVSTLSEEKENLEQEVKKLKEENIKYQKQTEELLTRIQELNGDLHDMQKKLQTADLSIENLKDKADVSEKSLKEAQNQNVHLTSSIESSSSRCEELLSELNNMNKVLRERGERISRLEATSKQKSEQLESTKSQLEELQNKMSSSEAELASKQEQLETITEKLQLCSTDVNAPIPCNESPDLRQLEEKVKELEQEKSSLNKVIQKLESELQATRENMAPCHDGQSEVMSTSTISRVEDTQRMKELEDTFEERYMKLKSVAIKLKKRVAELTAQLNSAEESRSKLATEKEDLKKKVDGGSSGTGGSSGSGGSKECLKFTSKNIQIMQGEIDRLQDEVDSKKKELKECGKQLNAAAEQLANVKSQYAESEEEKSKLLKTLKNQEESLETQRDESLSLRGQITALEKRIAAESEQQSTIEERRKTAEDRMEEERLKAAQYARELEEAKQDIKNKSLMDLEMRDYELTVEDLNNRLSEKENIIAELQADISREKGRSSSFQDQLTHLATQEATERERAEKMKKLLLEHKTQLAELRQIQEVQTASEESNKVTIEELTQEVERQKLVMADISSEKTKLEDILRKTKSSSERQIEALEEQVTKYKAENSQISCELDAIRKEFEGYKVRAASVLRQKARAPEVDVNELKGEKDKLQEDFEAAHLRIQQLQSELSALKAEYSFLQSEKEGIARQLSSVTEDLSKRETLHRERVTNLENKVEAKSTEYQLIIANMSSQNETMSNSFKKQIETMKQTHSKEVEDLTSKLEDTEDKLWQLKNSLNTSAPPATGASSGGLAVAHNIRSEPEQGVVVHSHTLQHRRQPSSHGIEEPRIDVSNMVREEGEGSEWVEPVHRSPSRPGGYSPPPLEQLISSPLPSSVGQPPQEDAISIASINTETTTKELVRLESKVSSQDTRIHQLTSLLHESEAENAKLAQLSDALKEEIRRTSRNESREKHMENMEYMKNIILKFLVMKSGEERKHMVPVLKTVLQLSPQETSDLEHFAVDGEEGAATQGWGSYLHLWSSR